MWHSPVKLSHVWVETSICFPEQHLHSACSQEVLTSTASDLHSRGNWRNRQMQLSSLKTSQDSEDSVLTLAEQKLQSIFSDPQLQRLEVVTTFSPVPASSAAAALPDTLGIQNNISFLIAPSDECGWNMTCLQTSSRTNTWKVCWEYLSLKARNTQAHE